MTESLQEQIKTKDLDKINKEEEERQLSKQLKEAQETLKEERYNAEKLKARKMFLNK